MPDVLIGSMDKYASPSIPLATVKDLPPEILSVAFNFSVIDIDFICYDQWANDVAAQAVACSHVCQFWRNVALNTPSLWTNIDRHHRGCEEFATRSKTLPLWIVGLEEYGRLETWRYYTMGWIQKHAGHIEGLQLGGSFQFLKEVVSGMGSIFPKLRSFRMDTHYRSPQKLSFRICAPRLRTFELRGSTSSFQLDGSPGLTSVCFAGFRNSVAAILWWLRRNPCLQSLSLVSMTLVAAPNDASVSAIALHHLKEFVLDDNSMLSSISLLNRIIIPASSPLLRSRGIVHNEELSSNDTRASIAIRTQLVSQFRMDVGGLHILQGFRSSISPLLQAITTSIDLSSITGLSIEAVHMLQEPIVYPWDAFFHGLPSLATLFVRAVASWLGPVFPALWPKSGQTACTQLRSLTLVLYERHLGTGPSEESKTMGRYLLQHLQRSNPSGLAFLSMLDVNFGDAVTRKTLDSFVKAQVSYITIA